MIRVNVMHPRLLIGLAGTFFIFAFLVSGGVSVAQTGFNPCAATPANPCAAQPKAMNVNPCAASPKTMAVNPCAARAAEDGIKTSLFTRPRGTALATGDQAKLIKEGERLFRDKSLSTNNYSCNACHAQFGLFNDTFASPYPHKVVMAEDNGMKQINLDEMVQLCLLGPMESKPLAWNSRKLAALTAYTAEIQKGFMAQNKAAMSPRSGNNPCAGR